MSLSLPQTDPADSRNAPQPAVYRLGPPGDALTNGRLVAARRFAGKAALVACVAVALVGGARLLMPADSDDVAEITATVVRGELPITVTERGELESSNSVDVRCELEGESHKIVEILQEGTRVAKDQIVVRLDAAEITQKLAEQVIKVKQAEAKAEVARQELEVAKNKAASEVAKAELTHTLAELDRDKYIEGDYRVEEDGLQGEIALQEATLQEDEAAVEHYRKLVKKGFRTPEQLRAMEQKAKRSQYYLDRDKAKLDVLRRFTKRRQVAELTAKAEEAKRDRERTTRSSAASVTKAETDHLAAIETARLEKVQQERMEKELAKTEVKAPQEGILVYGNERYWDPSNRIKEGALVFFQQKLFSLPDLTQMQVKVKVHEAMVKKVKPGQKAEIRIDAFPNLLLQGTVEKVGTLADSRYWDERGVKEYETIVKIGELCDAELKPGMTAEVTVHVNVLHDVLVVPVQAVTEREGQYFAYVVGDGAVERRVVTIGENNEKFVEIKEGVREGEQLALNARARMAAELKSSGGNGGGPQLSSKDAPKSSTDASSNTE